MRKINYILGDTVKVLNKELIYLRPAPSNSKHLKDYWQCFCGEVFIAARNNIRNGHTKSCGCWNVKVFSSKFKNPQNDYLYRLWGHIRNKCYNQNDPKFINYGKRGIKFFDDWKNNSELFISDILKELGHRPFDDFQLDRINNDGNYEPGNIRWASPKENSRNRSTNRLIIINGEIKTLAEWKEISGLTSSAILYRISNQWSDKNILKYSEKSKNNRNDLYSLWNGIKERCLNPGSKSFYNYGARGIIIFEKWIDDFKKFEEYIIVNLGPRPGYNYVLDRIDNNKGYLPENLRWASPKESARNKRNNKFININGENKTLAEWAEISGLSRNTINNRIKRGWESNKLLDPLILKKVSDEIVLLIRQEYEIIKNMNELSRKYEIRRSIITDIIHRRGAYSL